MNTIKGEILGTVRILVYRTTDGDKLFRVLVGNDDVADVGYIVEDMLKLY